MKNSFELKKGEKPIILVIGANAPISYINITLNGEPFFDRKYIPPRHTLEIKLPIAGIYKILTNGLFITGTKNFINDIDLKDMPKPEKGNNNILKPVVARVANINNSPSCIGIRDNFCDLVLNPKFKSMPIYAKIFVLFHELGHRFYNSEDKCDEYALKHCLARGWNRTQMFYALSRVLKYSDANIKRLEKIVGLLND